MRRHRIPRKKSRNLWNSYAGKRHRDNSVTSKRGGHRK